MWMGMFWVRDRPQTPDSNIKETTMWCTSKAAEIATQGPEIWLDTKIRARETACHCRHLVPSILLQHSFEQHWSRTGSPCVLCEVKYSSVWEEMAIDRPRDSHRWCPQESHQMCVHLRESSLCPKPYATFVDELSVMDGVLLKGQRIMMPSSMRPEMLRLLHEGHLRMEKCKRRAQDTMYWPAMNSDIDQLVGRCVTYLTYRNSQQKEPLIHHDLPLRPWVRIGCDIFYNLWGKGQVQQD